MAFEEDLDIFFDNDELSITVSYKPQSEAARDIEVLWSEGDGDDGIGDVEVEGIIYRCLCKKSDVAGAGEGDTITKDSITYYVKANDPTEDGLTTELVVEVD